MIENYVQQADEILFAHKLSQNLPQNIYSMHTHGMYELIYFLSGDATCVIEDRKYKLQKGDLILVRPLQYHFIQIDGSADYERYNILFNPRLHSIDSVLSLPETTEVVNLSGNPFAEHIFKRCDLYRENCDAATFQKLLMHLLNELFYNICVFPHDSTVSDEAVSPLVAKALQYINDHLSTITDIDEIASYLFVSKSNLFRCFKRELHQTPKRYITQKRLLLAKQRISQGEKPVDVYHSLGFGDYTTFYRNFVTHFGHRPSEK
ncbi:MAG: helix-turn-helix transcriptional regulator [Oscillospiraceae bacterium]|nr:helix-turn-helix transcriptional regulator [Oscillospiraceae bacterium]